MSVDPLVEITMSPYAYTWNDPVNYADPTGMIGERIGGPGEPNEDKVHEIQEIIIKGKRASWLTRFWRGLKREVKEGWIGSYTTKTNEDKYGGLERYRQWQSNPNYNEGESKTDRMFRLMGNSKREEMLDFGGGGYNMFGGYGRVMKVVSAVEKVTSTVEKVASTVEKAGLINAKSIAPQIGEAFQNLSAKISNGNISLSGRAVTNGRFDFVVTASGELKVGTGHFYLSGAANEVQAAGQIKLFKGQVMEISNISGHYQPSVIEAKQFPTIFSTMGVDVSKAKLKIYTVE